VSKKVSQKMVGTNPLYILGLLNLTRVDEVMVATAYVDPRPSPSFIRGEELPHQSDTVGCCTNPCHHVPHRAIARLPRGCGSFTDTNTATIT
jgi:hypothetical protein